MAVLACSPQAPAQNAPAQNEAAPQNVGMDVHAPQTGLRQVPLTIRSKTRAHHFTVDVAATPDEQEKGLMFVTSLPGDRGMIFPYDPPQEVAFWMKNTLIPLDIIYIRQDGTIVRIVKAEAMDLTPLPSGEPITSVLEIRGGRAGELGIKEGDTVSWTR